MQIGAVPSQGGQAAFKPVAKSTAESVCFLACHAYCCELDDGAIIMDLRNDTYLGIDAQHLYGLRTRIANWPDSGRGDPEPGHYDISACESLIIELFTRGILTTSPTAKNPSPAATPTMALAGATSAQSWRGISLSHLVHFLTALLIVAWSLRRKHLPSLLYWLRRQQFTICHDHWVTRESVTRKLSSFLWIRTWCYTASRHCFFDSLVLSVYLTKGSAPCTFVIGVATKPFLAHAWVQIRESVLNDTAEHACDFKPILSVGGR